MNREHGDGKTGMPGAGLGTLRRPGVSPACARSAHKTPPPQLPVRPFPFLYPVTPAKHPVTPAKHPVIPAKYLVIPAKAGISVKHGNTAPHDRDSRLRGNDEKVAIRTVSIRTGMKEAANETPPRPGRAAP